MAARPDRFNAFLDRQEPPVAHAAEGPLAGLTLAVKDIFDIAGQRTGCGNPQKLADARPTIATAPAIQRLLDAGARFVGRTQTDELAFSLMGQNAHFPQPVNPATPDRVTGGSSSGSAAAVAGGLADIALGSDTGGSIRAPASFCGLIGLRTTHSAIPLDGAMPLAPTLDTFGWFALDAETYERVGAVLLGPGDSPPLRGRWTEGPEGVVTEERGANALSHPAEKTPPGGFAATLPSRGRESAALRLAALDALVLGPAEAAEYERMAGVVSEILGTPADAPALSQPIDDLYWCFRRIQAHEAWASHGAWISTSDRGLGLGVKERFEFGATVDAATAAAETAKRDTFREELRDLLGKDGLLVLPTVPGAAPLRDASFDALQAYRERALRLLCLSGLSGFPQITLPLGAVDGAPFGISLLGPAGSDMALIRLGRRILDAAEGG